MSLRDANLAFRLKKVEKSKFIKSCKRFQVEPSAMLREMAIAFNENRITIKIPKTQLLILKGVHHVD